MSDISKHSDEQILDLIKASDQQALKELISRYWDRLLAIAINRLDQLEDAEECLQDVFFNLWKRRESIELRYTLATYLSVAVRYQSRDMLAKQHTQNLRAKYLPTITEDTASPSPEELLFEKELIQKLEETVKQLPEKCRIVYRLSREEGKSHKEISSELGISEKTVENHVTRAMKDIRSNLTTTIPAFVVWACTQDIHHRL